MPRIFLVLFMLLSLGLQAQKKNSSNITDACNRDEAKEKCKSALAPFRYSSMKTTHVTFKPYDQIKEIAVPLYYDTEYRLVFNLEGLPQDLKVEVYDKAIGMDDRKLIFEGSQKQFNFEPNASAGYDKLFINYIVPPTKNTDLEVIEKGCVVLVIGYQNI